MNPFVNPNKRDVLLPAGCKDLLDVLQLPNRDSLAGLSTPVIRPEIQMARLSEIHRYLERLVTSAAPRAVLAIAALDGQVRVFVEHAPSGLSIYPAMGVAEKESDALDFFASRGVQPCVDWLVGQSGMTTRVLGFPLPSNLTSVIEITLGLLFSVHGLDAGAEVEFTFFETIETP